MNEFTREPPTSPADDNACWICDNLCHAEQCPTGGVSDCAIFAVLDGSEGIDYYDLESDPEGYELDPSLFE